MSDDAELLARIRNGASDDFAELVQRYQNQVFAILYRYERDHQKLEDLAQETFIKVWRSLAQYDGRAPFPHWLSRIAVNVALDHLRRTRRNRNEVGLPELRSMSRWSGFEVKTNIANSSSSRQRSCSRLRCANFRRRNKSSLPCRNWKGAA